jgi:hypothetical protein
MDRSEATGLTRFGAMADRHWKEHRPRLYQHLKARSLLMPALLNAQERAKTMIGQMVGEQGYDLESAREEALREFVLLPSEDEEPVLSVDRMPFDQPAPTIRSRRKTP